MPCWATAAPSPPDPSSRTAHSVQLDALLRPRQIPHFVLVDLGNLPHRLPTTRAHQPTVSTLASHPQARSVRFFFDLATIDLVARPLQNLRPLALAHPGERTETPASIDQSFGFLQSPSHFVKCRHFFPEQAPTRGDCHHLCSKIQDPTCRWLRAHATRVYV